MKKLSFLFLVAFAMLTASAQKKQNVYFLKNDGQTVKVGDSADYVRVIEEPEPGEEYFNIKEFYQNGTRKLLGKVSKFEPVIVYEGSIVSYHKNGAKKSDVTYKKNLAIGMAYYFFENGKVKKQLEFLEEEKVEKDFRNLGSKSRLVYQVDSLGKVLVEDGNGHIVDTTKFEKDQLVEEGDYKDGVKDGVWKGYYISGKSSYEESYSSGKFIAGINTVGNETIKYTVMDSRPEFRGGIKAFYNYLGRSIRYPEIAYKNGISGSVLVSFTIEKDGSLTGAKVNRSVMPAIDQEALRVVMASPKWIPGMIRGLPVRVKYNIPISFKMGD